MLSSFGGFLFLFCHLFGWPGGKPSSKIHPFELPAIDGQAGLLPGLGFTGAGARVLPLEISNTPFSPLQKGLRIGWTVLG